MDFPITKLGELGVQLTAHGLGNPIKYGGPKLLRNYLNDWVDQKSRERETIDLSEKYGLLHEHFNECESCHDLRDEITKDTHAPTEQDTAA